MRTRLLFFWLLSSLIFSVGCDDGGGNNTSSDTDQSGEVEQDIVGDQVQTDQDSTEDQVEENHAPLLKHIGNRVVTIGEPLSLTVEASDPDGDALTYAVFGNLPKTASFNKDSHTFTWDPSPDEDGALLLLTFVVTDGQLDDRETLQIQATASNVALAPELDPIGDQVAEPGEAFELQINASDPNGDALTYSAEGLPSGASLSAEGLISWQVPSDAAGSTHPLTVTVSDGALESSESFAIIVTKGEEVLFSVRDTTDLQVRVGETLTATIDTESLSGVELTCAALSELPAGASFDTSSCTLTYNPTDPGLAGTSFQFIFKVRGERGEEALTLLARLSGTILEAAAPACTPDALEPNDEEDNPTGLIAGAYTGLTYCGDFDWYQFDVEAGQEVEVGIFFTHKINGDLDLYLFGENDTAPVMASDSSDDDELIVYTAEASEALYLLVSEPTEGQNNYDLVLEISSGGCVNDGNESNDGQSEATPLTAPAFVDAMICTEDEDWFSITAEANEILHLALAFDNSTGDLDLELYDATELKAASRLEEDEESIDFQNGAQATEYFVRVYGFQNASASYLLEAELEAGTPCSPDAWEPNNTPLGASPLLDLENQLSGLTYCGDPDYFIFEVPVGADGFIAEMSYSSPESVEFNLTNSSGAVLIASGQASSSGLEIVYDDVAAGGEFVLEITNGPIGLEYDLDVVVLVSPCDLLSCPAGEVCNDEGLCESEACFSDEDCAADYLCQQGRCANLCLDDSDCRTDQGYQCQLVEDLDLTFCAPTGNATTGEACESTADCDLQTLCLAGADYPGGMCAIPNCESDADCDASSACVEVGAANMCLPFCLEDGDCRQSEGYSCQSLPYLEGGDMDVCAAF